MLEKLKEIAPTTVEEIKPDTVRPATLHQVLVNLLRERISITALEKIVESAVQYGPQVKDPTQLTERIRANIGHIICDRFRDAAGNVRVIILEPKLEHHFRENVTAEAIVLRPDQLERLVMEIQAKWESSRLKDQIAAVLVDSSIRYPLHRTIFRSLPEVSVIAYSEIPTDLRIESVGMVRHEDILGGSDVGTASTLAFGTPEDDSSPKAEQ
jgi:flagellar biosynthesis protein FlhA